LPSSQTSSLATMPSPHADAQVDFGLLKSFSVTLKFEPHWLRSAWNITTS
jgi:hypothetical protein